MVIYEQQESEGHYRLLEIIREYGQERLAASRETEALRERHARFFLALAKAAEPELAGPNQGRWLDRLEREHANLRAALAWSSESHEIELGLRLGSALEGFWRTRGHLWEGRTQLLRLLAPLGAGAAAPSATRARALSTAGLLTSLQGDLKSAQALLEESMAIWRCLEDRAGSATVLHLLGWMAVEQHDVTTARPLAEESLAIRRELGEPRGLADALALLAKVCAHEGDPTARALLEESIAIWRILGDRVSVVRGLSSLAFEYRWSDGDSPGLLYEEVLATARELGDKAGIAWAVTGQGAIAMGRDDYPAARAFLEQSLPLWRELEDRRGLVCTLCYLGHVLRRLGYSAAAYALYGEALAVAREGNWGNFNVAGCLALLGNAAGDLGRWEETAAHCAECLRLTRSDENEQDRNNINLGIMGLGRVALAQGRPARAARLLAATEAPRRFPAYSGWPYLLAQAASPVRAQMESAEFDAAWAAGQVLRLEQIIAEALEEAPAG